MGMFIKPSKIFFLSSVRFFKTNNNIVKFQVKPRQVSQYIAMGLVEIKLFKYQRDMHLKASSRQISRSLYILFLSQGFTHNKAVKF